MANKNTQRIHVQLIWRNSFVELLAAAVQIYPVVIWLIAISILLSQTVWFKYLPEASSLIEQNYLLMLDEQVTRFEFGECFIIN